MILVDTSAWVEFLRDTGSPVCRKVDRALGGELATCHTVRMELLAGARDEPHLQDLRGLLARCSLLPIGPAAFDDAAALYRACRQQGVAVRRMIDCLIAAQAIAVDMPLLHADADFDALVRCTPLRQVLR